MIEVEWWEYDSLDELADAVAGDAGFIIDSAVDARNAALIAVPGRQDRPGDLSQARRAAAAVEAGDGDPDRRPAGADGQRPFQRPRNRPGFPSDRRARDPDRDRDRGL